MSEVGGVASLLLLLFHVVFSGVDSATFTILNKCAYPVWPGILSSAGIPQLSTTGFALQPSQSKDIPVPASWSGRLWGRTLCAQNATEGRFACVTGDCGSPTVECSGSGAVPPATLAEFTLDGAGGLDFYDVSLVDGYNLPMSVVPRGGKGGNCTSTGCAADLNAGCPKELQLDVDGGGSVACKSACYAFGDPKYCCSGAYSAPDTCKPSLYSEFFKTKCPRAYSYAYDDGTSTFTCASADYVVTFCPSPSTSVKTAGDQYAEAASDSSSGPTGLSASQTSASDHTRWRPTPLVAPVVLAAVWQLLQLLSP